MSKVLFLSVPSHGNVNPTLGLVNELVKQGEEVIYFSSNQFKETVEKTGAVFKSYAADLDIFKANGNGGKGGNLMGAMPKIINSAEVIIEDILHQIKDYKFDYLVHSFAFPYAKVIAGILKIPTVSSLAIFAGLRGFTERMNQPDDMPAAMNEMLKTYAGVAQKIRDKYSVEMPENILQLLLNKGDINLVYTSKYFAPDAGYFDDSYKFVGPPVYDRKEAGDFPFDQLQEKKVIYISLGTVFGNYKPDLYNIFFESFANTNFVVVMAAYGVDISSFIIPQNFIVRNYVPQSQILPYTNVAITHAGMNSISDLVYHQIPFVAIPLGADQPALAKRAEELGAAISLDVNNLTSDIVKTSVENVMNNPTYLQNIQKINESFKEAGGYPKAVAEICKLKKEKGIVN